MKNFNLEKNLLHRRFFMNLLSRGKTLLAISSLLALVSCGSGGPSLVSNVDSTIRSTNSGEMYLALSTEFDADSVQFGHFDMPIYSKGNERLGSISVTQDLMAETPSSRVTLNLELLRALTLYDEAQGSLLNTVVLPNGQRIPFMESDGLSVMAFGIGEEGSRLYISVKDNVAIVGYALIIPALDSVGDSMFGVSEDNISMAGVPGQVPAPSLGMNAFPTFDIGGHRGVAGVFIGDDEGTSGAAFFVRIRLSSEDSTDHQQETSIAQGGGGPAFSHTPIFREESSLSGERQIDLFKSVRNAVKANGNIVYFR